MEFKDLFKRAEGYFKQHFSVHVFHFTSDGMAFQIKADAEAHAASLDDTEVRTVLRTDVEIGDEDVPSAEPELEDTKAEVVSHKSTKIAKKKG